MVAKINADTSGGLKITSDTSGTLEIQSAGTTKFTVNSAGVDIPAIGTIDGLTSINGGQIGGSRNKIMNGAMVIDQRNAGAAVTPAATVYALDRYRLFVGAASKLTVQQVTDAPAGFTHSAKITVASNYTPASSEQFFYGTSFEAANVGDLGFGTAAAQTTTLSFWVKSSVTGTYSFSWTNNVNDRSYVGVFSVSSADTWEKKTATIAGDTTGAWPNTGNGRHSFLQIGLGGGSDFDGTAGVWQAGNLRQTSGSVDFVAQSNGATFYITGVQLEKGSTATAFEHRGIGEELALCQRYYQCDFGGTWGQAYNSTTGVIGLFTYAPMRTIPSVSLKSGGSHVIDVIGSTQTATGMTIGGLNSVNCITCTIAGLSGRATYQPLGIYHHNTELNAEL
jgi:hypothetical protein